MTADGVGQGKRIRGRSPIRYIYFITQLIGKTQPQSLKMSDDRDKLGVRLSLARWTNLKIIPSLRSWVRHQGFPTKSLWLLVPGQSRKRSFADSTDRLWRSARRRTWTNNDFPFFQQTSPAFRR